MAITAFSNLNMVVSDGGTVPSIDYLSNKTYVDIGSGNILKMSWNTPTATDNIVDSYNIHVQCYNSIKGGYQQIYKENIGNVNEFYLKSSMFSDMLQSFSKLLIHVEAVSKYGALYNGISNCEYVNVSKGCGNYTRVVEGYSQPVLKRTLAFTKLEYPLLLDSTGKPLLAFDGLAIRVKSSSAQMDLPDPRDTATSNWALMQEFYNKGADGSWQKSDIAYEVLTDANGEVVLDTNNNPVYVL